MEIEERIRLTWTDYGTLKDIYESPLNLTRDLYDQCILPVTMYGANTWFLTKNSISNLRVNYSYLEGNSRNSIDMNKRTRMKHVNEKATEIKWSWTEHVVRDVEKWSRI